MLTAKGSWCVCPREVEEKVENSDLPLLSVPGLVTRYQVYPTTYLTDLPYAPLFPSLLPFIIRIFFFA